MGITQEMLWTDGDKNTQMITVLDTQSSLPPCFIEPAVDEFNYNQNSFWSVFVKYRPL